MSRSCWELDTICPTCNIKYATNGRATWCNCGIAYPDGKVTFQDDKHRAVMEKKLMMSMGIPKEFLEKDHCSTSIEINARK